MLLCTVIAPFFLLVSTSLAHPNPAPSAIPTSAIADAPSPITNIPIPSNSDDPPKPPTSCGQYGIRGDDGQIYPRDLVFTRTCLGIKERPMIAIHNTECGLCFLYKTSDCTQHEVSIMDHWHPWTYTTEPIWGYWCMPL